MLATVFSWFKTKPEIKLRSAYDQKLQQAMLAQRNGDMRLYADLTADSESLWQQIEQLQSSTKK
jgi:hypothetical protein